MSPILKTILLSSAFLATAGSFAVQASAAPSERDWRGNHDADRSVNGNPRMKTVREARQEARTERNVPPQVQSPPASDEAGERVAARQAERVRRQPESRVEVQAGRPSRPSQPVSEVRDRSTRDTGPGVVRSVPRRDRRAVVIAPDVNQRRDGWRDASNDRRDDRRPDIRDDRRPETRTNRRDDRREDWRDGRHNDARDRHDDRQNRWRDAHRHDERERWRSHYHWPRVTVYPSARYSYRPYWWGTQFYYFDSRYTNYGYDYGSYYRPGYGYYGAQRGSGWAVLYPWLRQDPAGRHWVMWSFDSNRNGRLGKDEARHANREFERLADRNRDGYLSDREISLGIDGLRDEYRYSYQYG